MKKQYAAELAALLIITGGVAQSVIAADSNY